MGAKYYQGVCHSAVHVAKCLAAGAAPLVDQGVTQHQHSSSQGCTEEDWPHLRYFYFGLSNSSRVIFRKQNYNEQKGFK